MFRNLVNCVVVFFVFVVAAGCEFNRRPGGVQKPSLNRIMVTDNVKDTEILPYFLGKPLPDRTVPGAPPYIVRYSETVPLDFGGYYCGSIVTLQLKIYQAGKVGTPEGYLGEMSRTFIFPRRWIYADTYGNRYWDNLEYGGLIWTVDSLGNTPTSRQSTRDP